MSKIKKVIIEELDCVGMILNEFEMIPSQKDKKGRSRIFIRTEDKILGNLKIYDDGNIEFVKND
jgi:hypothetical protein